MIKFDEGNLAGVVDRLGLAISEAENLRASVTKVTYGVAGSPAMQAALTEHQSILLAQPGSFMQVQSKVARDIAFLFKNLNVHGDLLSIQDQASAEWLSALHFSSATKAFTWGQLMNMRDPQGPKNLMYVEPVAAAEATMPLQALIAAFSTGDAAPLAISRDWAQASVQLTSIMDHLEAAGRHLSATTIGTSFDMAREAIDAVVRTGRVVAANSQIMANTVAQFPTIRATNLAALEAIQASTATITDPRAKLAAEQSAVATFVSTHLQPSLELVRPPVSNLGIPIAGHTGGGLLTAGATGQGSAAPNIHRITGLTSAAAPSDSANAFGQAAQSAVQTAGQGNQAAVSAASAGTSPAVNSAANAPAPVAQAPAAATPAHGPAPAAPSTAAHGTGPMAGPAGAGGQGLNASRAMGTAQATPGMQPGGGAHSAQRNLAQVPTGHRRSGVGNTNAASQRGASQQRLPQLPHQAHQARMAREVSQRMGTGSRVGGEFGGHSRGALHSGHSIGHAPGAGAGVGAGVGANHGSTKGTGPGSTARGGGAAGFSGGHAGTAASPIGGSRTAGSGAGLGAVAGRGAAAGPGGAGAGSRGGLKATGSFNYGPEDRAYFKRLFMGKGSKTVRNVIR